MYCQKCGSEIDDSARFCSNCGTRATGCGDNPRMADVKDILDKYRSGDSERTRATTEYIQKRTYFNVNDELRQALCERKNREKVLALLLSKKTDYSALLRTDEGRRRACRMLCIDYSDEILTLLGIEIGECYQSSFDEEAKLEDVPFRNTKFYTGCFVDIIMLFAANALKH